MSDAFFVQPLKFSSWIFKSWNSVHDWNMVCIRLRIFYIY